MAKSTSSKAKRGTSRLAREAEGCAIGVVAGSALGMIAGPPGVAAGAVIGAVVGALSGSVIDGDTRRELAHTRELDEQLGVAGGELGAAGLKHPPVTRGTYSAASLGVGALSEDNPAEGPFQAPGD